MKRLYLLAGMWILAILGGWRLPAACGAEPAELIPDSAVLYAEVSKPGELLERALDPALVDLFRDVDDVRKYLASDDYRKLRGVITLVETRLGVKWQAVLADLIGGGVYVGAAPQHEAVLLIVRSRDAALAGKLNQALVELVQLDAANRGKESQVRSRSYRDVEIWSFGKREHHALAGDLLLVSNRAEAVEAAIDRLQNPELSSLADLPEYQQAHSRVAADQSGWAMARLAPIRAVPKIEKALSAKSNNPLAELLLAGPIEAFRNASFALASVEVGSDHFRFKAEAPLERSAVAETRSWYFSPPSEAAAPAPLRLPDTIATVTAYRDVSGMWQRRDELFDEITAARLGKADTDLGLFFAGREFESEVLGELAPRWQMLVARQEFAADRPVPAIRLPAFAVVLELKDPQEFGTTALVAYQKLVGIYNIAGGQQGKPPLLLTTHSHRGVTVSEAVFPPISDEPRENAAFHHNFNPSCAQAGNWFIIGSTSGIVRQAIDALQEGAAASPLADNARIELDAEQIADALFANRELLISQNMLEEGHDRAEAEKQIDLVLKLVRLVGQAQLRLSYENGVVEFEAAAGNTSN
ncbi:MAG: DUF3352 domain-containing protein [Planctomycetes bacterium]|nr:DUF3352 domain-containing protein [Planctomycetota bacterium]